jgi:DNA sulfur modification protein DndC
LTLEARLKGLEDIIAIQEEVNRRAFALSKPLLYLINAEEEQRIRELIALKTYPQGWDGTEPLGDVILDEVYSDGSIQKALEFL